MLSNIYLVNEITCVLFKWRKKSTAGPQNEENAHAAFSSFLLRKFRELKEVCESGQVVDTSDHQPKGPSDDSAIEATAAEARSSELVGDMEDKFQESERACQEYKGDLVSYESLMEDMHTEYDLISMQAKIVSDLLAYICIQKRFMKKTKLTTNVFASLCYLKVKYFSMVPLLILVIATMIAFYPTLAAITATDLWSNTHTHSHTEYIHIISDVTLTTTTSTTTKLTTSIKTRTKIKQLMTREMAIR